MIATSRETTLAQVDPELVGPAPGAAATAQEVEATMVRIMAETCAGA